MSFPKIIFTLTTVPYSNTNHENHWGIGDMMKGLNSLFKICNSMGIFLYVDFSTHPMHNFLKSMPHPHEQFVKEHIKEAIFLDHNTDLKTFLEAKANWSLETPILVFTNVDSRTHTTESKEFVKKTFFNFTSALLNAWSMKIPKDEYSILHFRLGDKYMCKRDVESRDYDRKFDKEFAIFKLKYESKDVLISDSKTFKSYVSQRCDCRMFDFNICHLGFEVEKESLDAVEHTLFDLYLVSKSQKIKSYSVYDWESGFVKETARIHDIDLLDLRS
jgi:hypothetical protein